MKTKIVLVLAVAGVVGYMGCHTSSSSEPKINENEILKVFLESNQFKALGIDKNLLSVESCLK